MEEDQGLGTRRERWWQAAHEITSWIETEFVDDPDDRAAADWLLGHHHRTKSQWTDDWLASRQKWSHAWRDAADGSDFELYLTPQQLSALAEDLHKVIHRYHAAGAEPGSDVKRVIVVLDMFPSPEPRV